MCMQIFKMKNYVRFKYYYSKLKYQRNNFQVVFRKFRKNCKQSNYLGLMKLSVIFYDSKNYYFGNQKS